MAMFKPSAESAIFRKFYAKLHIGIQMDLNPFAVHLYSAELISSEIRDVILMPSALESRASTLLNAIETGIKSSESVFWKFLEILEVFQKDLAAKLKAEGEKFQKTSEQYYGTDLPGSVPKFIEKEGVINSRVHYGPQPGPRETSGKSSPIFSAGSPTQLHESDDNRRVVNSTDFANNSRGLTMYNDPQPGPEKYPRNLAPHLEVAHLHSYMSQMTIKESLSRPTLLIMAEVLQCIMFHNQAPEKYPRKLAPHLVVAHLNSYMSQMSQSCLQMAKTVLQCIMVHNQAPEIAI